MPSGNLLHPLPDDLPEEWTEVLAGSDCLRIERIVSRGHASQPDIWYDQDQDEFVVVVAGRARLQYADDRMVDLVQGDYLLIPAHCRHRVDWTDPACDTIWLAVHF